MGLLANLFFLLDLGERGEDAQLAEFSAVSVVKSVLRNCIDVQVI